MQVLKWIVEPGMAQVWNEPPISYSLFLDSLSTGQRNGNVKPKALRIVDYEGLFIVFITLIFLSFLSFIVECVVTRRARANSANKLSELRKWAGGFRNYVSFRITRWSGKRIHDKVYCVYLHKSV